MKKLLSIVLSVLMILAIVPMASFTVSAADYTVTTEEDFAKYLGNGSNDTVTLGGDITVTTPIKNTTGATDTVDLAGYTVTYAPADPETTDAMISELNSTYNNSTLNIKNSVEGQGGFVNESELPLFATEGRGGVNFTTGEFYGDITAKIEGNNALTFKGAASVVNGKIDVDGNVNVTSTVTFAESVDCNYLNISSAAVFNKDINVDKFYASKGTFNGNIVGKTAIKANGSNIVFNGMLSSDTVALGEGTKAVQTIEANTFYALKGTYESAVTVKSKGTIIGGTFNGKIVAAENAEVLVAGGTVNAVEGNIVAKGGTFNFDPTSILGEKATATEKSGAFTVTNNSFEVNGIEYNSASSAVSNAGIGDTIKLIDDYYVTSNNTTVFTISKDDVTIDLNGKTITDLSDTGVFSGYNKFLYCNTAITKFTLTDSTYETTGGGNICIQGGGSNGGTEYCIAFRGLSGETPAELTFENCSFITNNSCWVNNGGAMQISGGSTADNIINFTNFVFKNTGSHALTGQGYTGINLGIKATINADNFDFYAERHGILCYSDNTVLNFKNSKFGYGRGVGINLNSTAANTNCVVNAENTKFYNTTYWAENIISIGANTANTTQSFKNCEFELYRGSGISAQGNNNTVIIKDSILKNTCGGSTFTLYLAGTDTVKVYNSQFKTPYYDSRIASINAGATLILDKNTTAVNSGEPSSAYVSAAFFMKGTSADVKASLKVNYFTMSGYRNFVDTNNAYADIYIEDFSFVRDTSSNQWNGGEKFVTNSSATVTLGEGYGVYEGDNEEPTEGFVWSASKQNVKKLKVFNPNLRLVTIDGETYKVNSGSEFTFPEFTVPNSEGYTIDYKELKKPGDKITVTEDMVFNTITHILDDTDFDIDLSDKIYTGKEIVPSIKTDLVKDTDYTVSITDNIVVGKASIELVGTGKCFGTVTKIFNITPKAITEDDFTFDLENKVYTGLEIKPEVTSTLGADDYEVAYTENVNVGTATITVTGKGNYGSEIVKTFSITPKAIEEDNFKFDLANKVYTGEEIKPEVTSTLGENDYEVVYSDNINAGTAKITVTGKGNYGETIEKTFTIEPKEITDADFAEIEAITYTGKEIKPELETKLVKDTEYTVDYKDNLNVGTATATITGINNYKGTVEKNFEIIGRKISKDDFKIEKQVYSGKALTPEIITDLKSEDYDVVWANNTNITSEGNMATATITGKGNCSGEVVIEFEITPKPITEADFTFDLTDKVYTGEEIKPEVKSTLGADDYEVKYTENVNVGKATITVTGKGNYQGKVEKTFNILPKYIVAENFTFDLEDKVYTGEEIKPEVKSTLTADDYEVAYTENVNVGTATITVTGKGNYKGTVEKTFAIVQKSLDKSDFESIVAQTYAGSALTPELNIVNKYLTEADFDVVYQDNVNVGTEAKAIVTGKRNFKGEVTLTFGITPKTIEEADFVIDNTSKVFTGAEIDAYVYSDTLQEGDYEVSYYDNISKGTATILITGKGNCEGVVYSGFEIVEKGIEEADFTFDLENKVYTGEEIKPEVKSTLTADDYEVAYTENVNVGKATITVTGKGNYGGKVVKTFEITAKDIADTDFTFDLDNKVYTGEEIKPEVKSTLTADDYEVAYTENVNVGTATITVTGKGNYAETITKTFEIVAKGIVDADFTFELTDKVYTGEEIKPEVTSTLGADDYEVAYTENVNVGTATITVTGKGNYGGKVVKTFEITAKGIVDADFTFDLTDKVYTGEEIKPEVTSTLGADDYEVAYTENVNVGTATITVTGKGNYAETITKTFTIVSKGIVDADFTFDLTNKVYTGKEIKPEVKSTLTADDYEVAYTENVNVGTATITVTGKGNYTATITKTFVIAKKAISASMFSVSTKSVVYTGKSITKTIKSSLVLNKDYKVTYKYNKYVGTAKITITGIGNYAGTVVKTFKIVKPKVATVKGLKVKAATKKMTVSWKKVTGAKGYKVVYSTSKNFKKAKTVWVNSGKTVKKVISKLKEGNYYVKVAAYKTYKNSKGKTVKTYGKYAVVKNTVEVK